MEILPYSQDYKTRVVGESKYKFLKVVPLEQSIQITTSAGPTMTFRIPAGTVLNLSRSYVQFSFQLAASAAYTYLRADNPFFAFNRLQVLPDSGSGSPLVDLSDPWLFSKISLKYDMPYKEYRTQDPSTCYFPSEAPVNVNLRADGQISGSIFSERHFIVSGNAAALNVNVVVPLNMLRDSILCQDKDIKVPTGLDLIFTFDALNQFAYAGTNANDPSDTATAYVAATTANVLPIAANTINFSPVLYVANQMNQEVYDDLNRRIRSGLKMLIPYPQRTFRSGFTGANQQPTVRYSRGSGKNLLKIYHSICVNTAAVNLIRANINSVATATAAQQNIGLQNFYTQIRGQRIQQINMLSGDASLTAANTGYGMDDYNTIKEKIRGKTILNARDYYSNWFWCDDFTIRKEDSPMDPLLTDEQGISLSDGDIDYQFVGTFDSTNAPASIHFNYGVFQREVIITDSTILVQ